MNDSIKIMSGFILGIGVGALASILLMPEKRDKTKRKILKKIENLVDDLESSTVEKVDRVRDQVVETVDKYAEKAKSRLKSSQPTPN